MPLTFPLSCVALATSRRGSGNLTRMHVVHVVTDSWIAILMDDVIQKNFLVVFQECREKVDCISQLLCKLESKILGGKTDQRGGWQRVCTD